MWDALKDAADILKHARPAEVVKALIPAKVRGLRVLNEGASEAVRPADVAHRLRDLRSMLKAEAVAENGTVSYAALRGSATYAELERTARLLPGADLASLASDQEKSAFWINLYNVLAIHGVIAVGVDTSVMEVPSFFSWVAYRVGPHTFTLDEIENGVLRDNAPHPATKRPLFADGDPRRSLSPSRVDPRIHAALVCASTSCPAVRFYDAEHLDEQLDIASAAYVAGSVRLLHERRAIELPITFRYYTADFEPGGARAFVLRHGGGAELEKAFDEGYAITYARYDWSLNGRI
jgi:hypothetical protein